ncbi:Major facilitator superfamily domain, general substrate transporter [Penicillium occitanis (nom. inval.)]|nr:Major facilitator superfamily domain, general substrate transporter [Penicillium occitanis (nom. inval.)]PCG90048.1 hypothetical protein PENOC_103950 [Penicillium occitanis (nom. inval.)]
MDNTSISGSPDCHGSNKLGEIQIIWGSTKKALLFIGLALAVIVFELDNSTTPSYSIYAATAFGKLSTVTAISTLANIVMASVKPIFATLADTCGRIEIYNITILFYIIGYCLCAAAQSFGVYVTGYFFYIIGQSGTNLLNNIIASDFSSVKWRAFAIQSIYSPVIFMPFVSGFILDNVVGGIGWRWGIGMFAIIMPLGVSLLIFMAFYLQYRTQKPEFFPWKISSTYGFYKNVDIVGIILISGGTALLLCPISWVGVFQDRWNVPWVYVLVGVGALMLGAAYIYEKQFTSRPFIPVNYFTDRTILLTCLLILLDRIAFWVTHVYISGTRHWNDGIVQSGCSTGLFPRAALAKVTSLWYLCGYVGSSIGSCIAGGIYVGQLKKRLKYHLGSNANDVQVDLYYDAVLAALPPWGTDERIGVNDAYGDIMR